MGGPVYIPKLYDGRNKTFLFFGQGLYYARLGGAGGLQTIPRADFKTGDFSRFVDATGAQIPIFDPSTTRPDGTGSFVRVQFPGNVIPASRISESLTWTRGRHTLKFGFYHWRYLNNSRNQSSTAGNFTFNNQMTSQPDSSKLSSWGSSFASFLLGELSSANTTLQSATGYRFRSYSLFAQDDWRMTSKLTMSYGLRWDVAPAPYEVNSQVGSFSPAAMNPVGVPGALVFGGSGTGRTGNQFILTWKKGFGPRLGLAYELNSKTIIRSSGGIYYSDQAVSGGYTAGFTASPSFSSADNYTPVYNWGAAGFPQNYNRPPQLIPEFQNNQSITWLLGDGGWAPLRAARRSSNS